MPKITITAVKDLRNIAIAAVRNTGLDRQIKIKFPFENGRQIEINYDEPKFLFTYACEYGKLISQVNPEALKDLKDKSECSFFCCANCKTLGIEKRDKVITNYCKGCAKTHTEENIKKVEEKRKLLTPSVIIKEPEVKTFSPFIKEQELKKKKTNPIKLKFNK